MMGMRDIIDGFNGLDSANGASPEKGRQSEFM